MESRIVIEYLRDQMMSSHQQIILLSWPLQKKPYKIQSSLPISIVFFYFIAPNLFTQTIPKPRLLQLFA